MKVYDLAKMSVSGTPGTGTITLGTAVSGYLTFAQAGVQDGDWLTYAILDGANCEVARGKYSASGTTLTRARTLRSTGSGNNTPISASSSAIVLISAAAEDLHHTGDLMLTLATSAPDGWVMMNDGTVGSGASSASTRNNDDTYDLFAILYSYADADCPILTSAGSATTRAAQTNLATAWSNNCRITLPLALGRAFAISGAGSGLTSRVLGHAVGEETHLLTTGEMPAHTHSFEADGNGGPHVSANGDGTGGSFNTSSAGGGGAHNNMQPTTFVNVMVKL
jgi:hypothetical protein